MLSKFRGVQIDGADGTVGKVVGARQQDDATWTLKVRYGRERTVYEYPERDLLCFLPAPGSECESMGGGATILVDA